MAGPKENKPMTKRCHSCGIHLKVDATECHSCKKRVGPPDEHGTAKKPFNWKGYGISIIAWVVFGYYIWWAFIRKAG